jgi:hypothetical protein
MARTHEVLRGRYLRLHMCGEVHDEVRRRRPHRAYSPFGEYPSPAGSRASSLPPSSTTAMDVDASVPSNLGKRKLAVPPASSRVLRSRSRSAVAAPAGALTDAACR